MTALELLGGRSCRDCIARHVGPAVETVASVGTYRTCGGCGQLRVVYAFTYWYPWPEMPEPRPWHPSMGRRAESTLCDDCGEEGGNHAGDCPVYDPADEAIYDIEEDY